MRELVNSLHIGGDKALKELKDLEQLLGHQHKANNNEYLYIRSQILFLLVDMVSVWQLTNHF